MLKKNLSISFWVKLFLAILLVFFGNVFCYWIYEVILRKENLDFGNILSFEFILKVFKFPAAIFLAICFFLTIDYSINKHSSTAYRLFNPKRDHSTTEDLVYTILNLGSISRILSLLFSFGIGVQLSRFIEINFGLSLLSGANWLIQFLAAFLLIPLFEYWHHRLMHTELFWEIHRVHHAANYFNGLTTFRVHPLDSALAGPFRVFPVALLGVRPDLIAIYSLMNLCYQVWVHSEIYINYPRLRKYILIDPSLHRIHHSSEPKYYDKNFGILSIYDRMFGTYQNIEQSPKDIPIGFEDDPIHNQGRPFFTMVSVFRNWLRGVIKRN